MATQLTFRRLYCTIGAVLLSATSLMAQTIEVENLDGAPFPDRLAFSRIGSLSAPPPNGVHERVVLRVWNRGSSTLSVTSLLLGGPDRSRWMIENAPALPMSISPGTSVDLTVRFIAEAARRVHNATLTIASNDSARPNVVVSLGGYWQNVSEGNKEPTFQQILDVLAYPITTVSEGQVLNTRGKITATGDEVISAYWRRADPGSPVTVRQLAAWHTYPENHPVFWHYKGSSTATVIFRHHGEDSQSILPRRINSEQPALGSFTPSSSTADGVFGFRVHGNEWSDPALNNSSNDDCSDGPGTCGQHVRFWHAKDRQGALIPNTFIMTMDFAGINYDYQDNVYLISNVTPSMPVAGLQDIRINAGGPAVTTGGKSYMADSYSSGGQSWTPKCDLGDIAGTTDDVLYRTEYSDGNPFHYAIPAIAGVYNVRLHFAEIAHGNCSGSAGGPGKRVFDVWLEGMKILDDFDISAEVAPVTALIKEFQVGIADGILNLDFLASVDFPMISAIEVLATDNKLPVVSFTTTPTSGYAPLNVSFNAGASTDDGFISSYSWSFGDGNSGTGVAPSHTYSVAGAYTVMLTVRDDQGAWKSKTQTITVGVSGATSSIGTVSWTQAKNQPYKNAEGQGVVVLGKLYSFGGFDSQKTCCTPTKRSYVFDPGANKWTAIADLPHVNGGGATHHGVTTDGTNIYIAGGYIADATGSAQIFGTKEVYRYDVAANSYMTLPNLPVERAGGRLEHLNGKLYYFGGTNLQRTMDVGDLFVLDLSNLSAGWKSAARLPNPRHHMASVVLGSSIYAIGGQHKHDGNLVTQSSVHAYNPAADVWTAVADLPLARSHHATAILDGRIISFGGEKKHTRAISNVDAYDPATNTWTALTPLPRNRRSGIAGVIDGFLYYSGGNNALQTYKGSLPSSGANQEPVAAFTAVPEASEDPLTVGFDAGESIDPDGKIVSYAWDFGEVDGVDSVAAESSAVYTYSSPGTYIVTLTVTDDIGATSATTDTVAVSEGSADGSYFTESGGQVVMEAESVHGNIARGSHSWTLATTDGNVGSSMHADPNTGANFGDPSLSSELQYRVQFSTTGIYYVWARVWGETPDDDSFYAGIDGVPIPTAISLKNGQRGQWFWVNLLMGSNTRAAVNVANIGEQTLSVWMREDGLYLDRLLLTTDAGFTPTGEGPVESTQHNTVLSEDSLVAAFSETGGQTVFEIEHFDEADSRSDKNWVLQNLSGNVGGSMRPEPVSGILIDSDYAASSPELKYAVHFETAGTYYVWARAQAAGGNSDSWHVGVDGVEITSADRMTIGNNFNSWRWIKETMDAERASIEIASTGLHTIHLWMREDGVYLDRLLLTTDPDFVPSGSGPDESPRIDVVNSAVLPRSIAKAPLSTSNADIALASEPLPNHFELSGNYPNPFNPTTTIQYSLPEEVHVRLEVFDILGRRVAVLVDEAQRPGFHEAGFDANGLASGMYLYRIQAGTFVSVAKMILLE